MRRWLWGKEGDTDFLRRCAGTHPLFTHPPNDLGCWLVVSINNVSLNPTGDRLTGSGAITGPFDRGAHESTNWYWILIAGPAPTKKIESNKYEP